MQMINKFSFSDFIHTKRFMVRVFRDYEYPHTLTVNLLNYIKIKE